MCGIILEGVGEGHIEFREMTGVDTPHNRRQHQKILAFCRQLETMALQHLQQKDARTHLR